MAETRCCTSQLYGPIRAQKQKRSPLAWAPDLRIWTVGVAGFEPTASSSRTKRATKLRHTPAGRCGV